MAEPTSSTTITSAIFSTLSISALLNGLDAGIILGALCGAMLLVLSQKEISLLKRLFFFLISFSLGVFLNELFSYAISLVIPTNLNDKLPAGFGALIASAISVKLLLWLINQADDPFNILNSMRGTKNDDN